MLERFLEFVDWVQVRNPIDVNQSVNTSFFDYGKIHLVAVLDDLNIGFVAAFGCRVQRKHFDYLPYIGDKDY